MPIEIDGVEYRTEKQWERVHRHVKKGAKGVYREWNAPNGWKRATFYPESQTKPWTQAEKNRANKERRAAKAEKEIQRRIEEAVKAEHDSTADCYKRPNEGKRNAAVMECTEAPEEYYGQMSFLLEPHGALEWLEAGFVPIDVAAWDYKGRGGVYTCKWWDVRYDMERAEELAKVRPYGPGDGRPWWVKRIVYKDWFRQIRFDSMMNQE